MNAAALDLTSFEVIDRTGGHDDAREIADDVNHNGFDGTTISAAVGHAARVGLDDEVVCEWLNTDREDLVLAGMPSDMRPGKTRAYLPEDVQRMFKTPRFKALLRERQRAESEHERQVVRRQRAEATAAAKLKATVDAEIALFPTVYAMLVERIAELERELAARR